MKRHGFSLLEVILALAILTGAIAVLGELARLGLHNARHARDISIAQLLCQSKLAEITAKITAPDPISKAPFDLVSDPDEPAWFYSIELAPLDEEGLVAVRVTVEQDLPEAKRPVRVALVRWIVDPGIEMSDPTAENSAAETSSAESSESGGSRE